ncbi:DNA-processing protein DprA [Patescibacteria group bacterium]|nr:DNA-processing protein DprA [Patescibacteria group bacterium]MBU4078306.1 DNA-processing protein DprA [Patescibacteria group bacterium]
MSLLKIYLMTTDKDIKEIGIKDQNFPMPLAQIPNSPGALYYKGDLTLGNSPIIGIVGTRRCSDYGRQAAIEITSGLTRAGFIIVSGLARGIDTIAHKTALENNGKTIAFIGTGLNKKNIYPQENLGLAEKIVEQGGAIISELKPDTPGFKSNFLRRNRLISGLSSAILVIEAKNRSGALNTAYHAFRQKKKVFALPGSIYSPNSKGCNLLIKKGACLIESADDIIKGLNLNLKIPEKEFIPGTEEEKIIIALLKNSKAMYIDEIIQKSNLNPAKVSAVLTNLEMLEKIKNLGGQVYAISK